MMSGIKPDGSDYSGYEVDHQTRRQRSAVRRVIGDDERIGAGVTYKDASPCRIRRRRQNPAVAGARRRRADRVLVDGRRQPNGFCTLGALVAMTLSNASSMRRGFTMRGLFAAAAALVFGVSALAVDPIGYVLTDRIAGHGRRDAEHERSRGGKQTAHGGTSRLMDDALLSVIATNASSMRRGFTMRGLFAAAAALVFGVSAAVAGDPVGRYISYWIDSKSGRGQSDVTVRLIAANGRHLRTVTSDDRGHSCCRFE